MAVKTIEDLDKRLKKAVSGNKPAAPQTRGLNQAPTAPSMRGLNSPGMDSPPAPGTDVTKTPLDSNVSNIAAEMMSQENPMMRRAKTSGLQTANSRGMLNSSMAVEAAQGAVIDRITPLISQESGQRHGLNMSDVQYNQGLEAQRREQEFARGEREGAEKFQTTEREAIQAYETSEREAQFQNIMTQLGAEQAFARAESAAEREHAANMLAQELHADMELAQLDSATRENLVRIESEYEAQLLGLELDAQQAEIAADMFVSVQGQYQQTLQSILNNPDMSADDRNSLINSMQGMLDANVTAIEGMQGVQIDFNAGQANVTPTVPTPTPAPNTLPAGNTWTGTFDGTNPPPANPFTTPNAPRQSGR